jgi:acyl-CoA thioesterase
MFESLADTWRAEEENRTIVRGTTDVPETWGQGRAVFGGLVAALAHALGARLAPDRVLRTVHVQFLAPLAPGPARGEATRLREGRTTAVVDVVLHQNDRPAARVALTFVTPQPEATSVPGPAAPDWPAPEDSQALPYLPGITPEFTQHVDFRWATGGMPFQGAEHAAFGGYVRFTDGGGPSVERTLGLLDAWPCPTLSILTGPAPASSVTWTAHLVAPPQAGFHAFAYETVVADGGFSTAVGRMWGPDGRFVAYTEQTVAVFG